MRPSDTSLRNSMNQSEVNKIAFVSDVYNKYFGKASSVVKERSVFTSFVMAVAGAILALSGTLTWYLRAPAFFFLFVIAYLGFVVTLALRIPYIKFSRKAEEIMIAEFGLVDYCRYFPSDLNFFCESKKVSKDTRRKIIEKLREIHESKRNAQLKDSTLEQTDWKPMSVTTIFLIFFAILSILGQFLTIITIAEGVDFFILPMEIQILFVLISVIIIISWSAFLVSSAAKMKEMVNNMLIEHVEHVVQPTNLLTGPSMASA